MSVRAKRRREGEEEAPNGFEPHAVVFRADRVESMMHDPVRKKGMLVFDSGTKLTFGCQKPEAFTSLSRVVTSNPTGWTVYTPEGEYTDLMDAFGEVIPLWNKPPPNRDEGVEDTPNRVE
jgi:hypothetical protein